MASLRVLIADDSMTARARFSRALAADPSFEIVAEVDNGQDAVERCVQLGPDVVMLDITMPRLDGVDATAEIMRSRPTPILLVSSADSHGEIHGALDALTAGAVDVIEKPRAGDASWDQRLRAALRLVAGVRVVTRSRGGRRERAVGGPRLRGSAARLVAIGGSTGAPGALAELLRALPPWFDLPLLVVVHANPCFGSMLVEWLDRQSRVRVRTAIDGTPLPPRGGPPVAFIAPPEHHLLVRGGVLRWSGAPEHHGCRPSVDVLFASVAVEYGSRAVGCLLTGMGRDGAEGLLAMRRAGAATIVQDEASSVVFGMPHEALRLGAASHAAPPRAIGERLGALAGCEPERRVAR